MRNATRVVFLSIATFFTFITLFLLGPAYSLAADNQDVSTAFNSGPVPSGTVIHTNEGKKHVLTLSDDFKVNEGPPDVHWRVVDASGNVFQLEKLKVKDNKINKSITLPSHIESVAKVQMWCAFVEMVLGEVSFPKPINLK
jgi:hypothetical protein